MKAAIAGEAPLSTGPFAGLARAVLDRLDRLGVPLPPLGDLEVSSRRAFEAMEPKAGGTLVVPVRRILVFRPSDALKRALNPSA